VGGSAPDADEDQEVLLDDDAVVVTSPPDVPEGTCWLPTLISNHRREAARRGDCARDGREPRRTGFQVRDRPDPNAGELPLVLTSSHD
jgi:hypothetical protein